MAKSSDYAEFYSQYMKRLTAKAKAEVMKATEKTYAEYFMYVEKRVREIFNDAIQQFYADYSPALYDRSYSLYRLIQTKIESNGRGLSIWFEPSEMTSMRSGYNGEDGLYDQVFRKGWHGGADKISPDKAERSGAHPQPGTPYWRTPHPLYTAWGRKAEEAETSPLDNMRNMLEKYEKSEFPDMLNKIWKKNRDNIKIT